MTDIGMRIADGVNVNKLTDHIIKKYDKNGDKTIDLGREDALIVEGKKAQNSDTVLLTKLTMGSLFKDTDKAGNNDGKTTRQELYKFIDKFDTNKDGDLDANPLLKRFFFGDGELEKFDNKYSETTQFGTKKIDK